MRVAALYDIHGNLPALEAVLADVERATPDVFLVGGDVVSGPFPRETLDRLTSLGEVRFIRGNADRAIANDDPRSPWPDRDAWVRAQLTSEQRRFLGGLPETAIIGVDGLGAVLFCHATPRSDEEIVTRATPSERLREMLAGVEQGVIVCGHTHVQFDRVVDNFRVVNAGSIGMPYEDEAGAYWALLGPTVDLRRTEYDAERAAEAIRATDYPDAARFAEEHVLHPAGADEATEYFERMGAGRA